MENIELWIIGILFATTAISLIMLKESRHFAKYWKDLYFIQKDLNEKMEKASDGNHAYLKNGKLPIPRVSGSLLPGEDWISKNAPLNPDATEEDVLIHNWWIGGAKDYRDEVLRRLQQ